MLEELADISRVYYPVRRPCDRLGDLCEGMRPVRVLGYPVEQLGDLHEPPVTLDEPLPLCETGLGHFTDEVNIGAKHWPLRQLSRGELREYLGLRYSRERF